MKQLKRAGFKIIVAHGHGPSTKFFKKHSKEWEEKFNIKCLTCWEKEKKDEDSSFQVKHAAKNETSLLLEIRPDLVKMNNLPEDLRKKPIGIEGKDPRKHANAKTGKKIIKKQKKRMSQKLKKLLKKTK